MDRISAVYDESSFCSDCQYFGEPHGCNREDGICSAYEMWQDAWEDINRISAIADAAIADLQTMVLTDGYCFVCKYNRETALCEFWHTCENGDKWKWRGLPTRQHSGGEINVLL